MQTGLYLSDGVIIHERITRNCIEATFVAIENELPEEARSYEGYQSILEICLEELKRKRIVL